MIMKQIPAHPNNYGIGRNGHKVDKIILHWIAGTLASCDATFQNPTRKASVHYGIGGDKVHQYVNESDTAWHAGNLTVNRQSIGIEHEGSPTIPISDKTYKTSSLFIRDICQRYGIPLDREHIKGHNEISATQCPGTLDIDKLIKMASVIIDNMTPEEKKVLEILTNFYKNNDELKNGNLEGAINALIGWANDLPGYKKINNELADKVSMQGEEIDGLKKTISDLFKDMDKINLKYGKLLEEFNILLPKYEELLKNQTHQHSNETIANDLTWQKLLILLIHKIFKK